LVKNEIGLTKGLPLREITRSWYSNIHWHDLNLVD
jgi:hypothetical protein